MPAAFAGRAGRGAAARRESRGLDAPSRTPGGFCCRPDAAYGFGAGRRSGGEPVAQNGKRDLVRIVRSRPEGTRCRCDSGGAFRFFAPGACASSGMARASGPAPAPAASVRTAAVTAARESCKIKPQCSKLSDLSDRLNTFDRHCPDYKTVLPSRKAAARPLHGKSYEIEADTKAFRPARNLLLLSQFSGVLRPCRPLFPFFPFFSDVPRRCGREERAVADRKHHKQRESKRSNYA